MNYPVAVTYAPLMIISGAPPATGTVGVPYGPFTAAAAGGSGSYLWSVSGIPGVTINGGSGVLGGKPTASASSLTIVVTDTSTLLSTSQSYAVEHRERGTDDHHFVPAERHRKSAILSPALGDGRLRLL